MHYPKPHPYETKISDYNIHWLFGVYNWQKGLDVFSFVLFFTAVVYFTLLYKIEAKPIVQQNKK